MVQMFPTLFDHTLELLSVVEKQPDLDGPRLWDRNLIRYQAEMRFFRMFVWCFPDCDANLLADLNFTATSIFGLYKFERARYCRFSLSDTEYDSLRATVDDKIHRCHAGINKYLISSSSLKAEPFTGKETIKFLDSVHLSMNELLNSVQGGFPTVKSQIETLEELVFLLRNLFYYTPLGEESYTPMGEENQEGSFGFRWMFLLCFSQCHSDANPQTNLISQFNVHDWANKAACFFLLNWLNQMEDEENSQEIRRLSIDLQQKVDPCNPDFIKLCFQNIKVPKMKRVDRILFGEFVSRLVDFFLDNLILILNDDVPLVREGLIFLLTFLADPPANIAKYSELSSIRKQIHAVLDQASDTICFFGDTNMDLVRGKTILGDLQKSIDEVRWKIESLYVQIPHSSWSNFPRIDRLGYLECLLEYLENLKETMKNNKKFVPFLKHQMFTIQEELLPLRLFLQDTSTMQNENNGLKDIWEQITSLLYQSDFAIKSSFFIDNTIWYNLTCLSFVIRGIKDTRNQISNIVFETQTEGSHIDRTEAVFPLMNSINVPKAPTSTSPVEVVVGFKKETELLLDSLKYGSEQLDIVSIVGMGGIGKTTLAKKLYNEPSIIHRFHKRAFFSVSQAYRKRNVLLDILRDISSKDDEIRQMSDDDLADQLRKNLKGYRYLIVLDDIWDIKVWEDLRYSFPDDSNGSKVIFTTRINSISTSTPCQLPFLSSEESWEMLQQYIFHKDPCPQHLLEVGKLIAMNCKGLPLAIAVIAGLLARRERSLLQWNEVADTLISFASSEGCSDIIKLSYKHLPEALKSCFLCLGAFREDENIDAKKLALLWVGEGFVLKSENSCLHKIAKNYLNNLGDRNLVIITERSCNGGIKRFRVHDLIRDFCITEAQEEHYMFFVDEQNKDFAMSSVLYQYRININVEDEWRSFVDTELEGPTVHSLLFLSAYLETFSDARFKENFLQSFLQNLKVVQVLDLGKINIFGEFPRTVATLIHLRYLALVFSEDVSIPPDISNLWNLKTLVLSANRGGIGLVKFPNDIWKMKKLRHVEAEYMAYVALGGVTGVFSLLPDLENFSRLYIPPGEDGEELLRRLSNVRKFSCICQGWWDPHRECNQLPKLEILTKLESLKMENTEVARHPYMFSFPSTIRKLTLRKFNLPWNEFSAIIRMLPCLEVLVLDDNSFSGKIWNVEDEQFPNIKSLTLNWLDIEEWNASNDLFPSLEKLVVSFCSKLIEIPPCFSDVTTLEYIKVQACKKSVAHSAIQIKKDQIDAGNESFEVELSSINP